ncbi:MAG TPA: glycosyltransferase family 4 protein [Burkholderiaceae bacterium]|nr:glycosyltransferase family 4 protein [Burkholderiaceae bacterium]
MPTVLLLGPDLTAVSGISTHLRLILESPLRADFILLHFRVGSEGRRESALQKAWRALASPWQLLGLLLRRRPDVVHINTAMDAKAFWRDLVYLAVARTCGTRIILQVHGGALPQEFMAGSALFGWLLRRVLEVPDLVLLLGSSEYRAYRAFAPGLRARVVANAIDTGPSAFDSLEGFDQHGDLKLVFIGRLVAAKGLFEAIDAIAMLRDQGLRVEFVIAGSGVDESRLRSEVAARGLDDRISFAGAVFGPDKKRLLSKAQVLLFPSHREGLPYALLEGMAAGALPVTCPVGAIPDVVVDGQHGFLVPPRDPAALASAIRWIDQNRCAASDMVRAAKDRVASAYSVPRLVADLRLVYGTS